jgi:hypothetical protein
MTETTSFSDQSRTPAENPGKKLGVIGLVLAILFNVVGLIVSIVALRKSKKAGFKNVAAVWGIIIGLLSTLGIVIMIIGGVAAITATAAFCAENGPGVHENGAVTVTCGE